MRSQEDRRWRLEQARAARDRLATLGLDSFFTKDIKDVKGISTINSRAQTVATSRTYREPFERRRCLVPASGFYEWKRLDPKDKQPFAFDLLNGKMMAFAGLWDGWKDPANGQWLQSPSPPTRWKP